MSSKSDASTRTDATEHWLLVQKMAGKKFEIGSRTSKTTLLAAVVSGFPRVLALAMMAEVMTPENAGQFTKQVGTEGVKEATAAIEGHLATTTDSTARIAAARYALAIAMRRQMKLLIEVAEGQQLAIHQTARATLQLLQDNPLAATAIATTKSLHAPSIDVLCHPARVRLLMMLWMPGFVTRGSEKEKVEPAPNHVLALQSVQELYNKEDWKTFDEKITERMGERRKEKKRSRPEQKAVAATVAEPQEPPAFAFTADPPPVHMDAYDMSDESDGSPDSEGENEGHDEATGRALMQALRRMMTGKGDSADSQQVFDVLTGVYGINKRTARRAAGLIKRFGTTTEHNARPLMALCAALMEAPHEDALFVSLIENFAMPGRHLHGLLRGRLDAIKFSTSCSAYKSTFKRLAGYVREKAHITGSTHGKDTVGALAELVGIFIVSMDEPTIFRLVDWVAVAKKSNELKGSTAIKTIQALGDVELRSELNRAIARYTPRSEGAAPFRNLEHMKNDVDLLCGATFTHASIVDNDADDKAQEKARDTKDESQGGISRSAFAAEMFRRLQPLLKNKCLKCGEAGHGTKSCPRSMRALEQRHPGLYQQVPCLGGILSLLGLLETALTSNSA